MPDPFYTPAQADGPERAVTVLTVASSDEDHSALAEILHRTNWRVRQARGCRQALDVLRSERIPVVVCDCKFADGCWKDILAQVGDDDDSPLLVVTSRNADDYFWGEVLNLGGYDVLAKPFEPEEVVRIVSLAWLQWKHRSRGMVGLKATA